VRELRANEVAVGRDDDFGVGVVDRAIEGEIGGGGLRPALVLEIGPEVNSSGRGEQRSIEECGLSGQRRTLVAEQRASGRYAWIHRRFMRKNWYGW